MNFNWVKTLIIGSIVIVIIIFSSIVIFNIVANHVPLPGMEKKIPSEPPSEFNNSLKYENKISVDDPSLGKIITEKQAWEYAWSYYHEKTGMTIFLPLEKRSLGLHKFSDQQGNEYVVWGFNAIQNSHTVYFVTGFSRGGMINIDAYSGNVLSFSEFA